MPSFRHFKIVYVEEIRSYALEVAGKRWSAENMRKIFNFPLCKREDFQYNVI